MLPKIFPFQKKKEKDVLSDLIFLAEVFDGYTTGRNTNPNRVKGVLEREEALLRQKIDKLEQKRIIDDTDFIINLPKKEERTTFYVNLFLMIKLLIRLFGVLFVFLMAFIITSRDFDETTVLILGWGFVAIIFLRWLSLTKILEFYDTEMKSQQGKLRHLKDGAQKIIYLISEYKDKKKSSSKKKRLHLYNNDYQNIKVIRSPGILRDYYLIEVI
jgi:hypothetical protein